MKLYNTTLKLVIMFIKLALLTAMPHYEAVNEANLTNILINLSIVLYNSGYIKLSLQSKINIKSPNPLHSRPSPLIMHGQSGGWLL